MVVEDEAAIVRQVFALYRAHRNVRQVKQESDRLGLRTKQRTNKHGAITGGKPFTRGHLYVLLGNPLYIGKIRHKAAIYEGQHQAIIEGRQPVDITVSRLRRSNRLPMLWTEQRAYLGFAQNHASC